MLIPIVIAGLVIEVLCIRIASLGDIMQHIPRFSLMYSTAFVAYLFAVFLVSKNAALSGKSSNISKKIIWIILVFSLVFRLTLLPATPSNDIFRYLWEGKIQLHGINPYSQPPVSLNLEHLRDNYFSGINHKHLTTIYPPLTLMVFAIAEFISHSFVSIKSAFLFFDILSIFVLIKYLKVMRKEPANVLIYAWSPLVLISFAARGHCDSLQIFFVMLALYLYSTRKYANAVVSISLAMMS